MRMKFRQAQQRAVNRLTPDMQLFLKKKKASTEKNLKRKLKMDELADVKCQKHSMSYTIDALNKDMEKFYFYLSKANVIRKTVAEKQKLVKSLDSTIAKLEIECKAL